MKSTRVLPVAVAAALLLVGCSSDDAEPSADTGPTSELTTPGTEDPLVTSTDTPAPVTEPVLTEPAATDSLIVEDGECPQIEFTSLPDGWPYTAFDMQGGDSGLPGLHLEGPSGFVNIFPGGSIHGPQEGAGLQIDNVTSIQGPIEDGYGIRLEIGEAACEFIDLGFYGPSQAETDLIAAGILVGP